jgi:hypothetical protein
MRIMTSIQSPMRYSIFLALVFASHTGFSASKQLVIDTDESHYLATYDPNRISEARLKELLVLSPYLELGQDLWKIDGTEMLIGGQQSPGFLEKSPIPISLEQCIANDPRYRPCGKRNISDPNFFANAEVNVRNNEQALAALNRLEVPAELRPILQHFQDAMAFHVTLEERRLQYLRTGDLQVLSTPIGVIDPPKRCVQQLNELQLATTLTRRYQLSRYSWHKCLNNAWLRASPGYPIKAWHGFLSAFGITERFTVKSVD